MVFERSGGWGQRLNDYKLALDPSNGPDPICDYGAGGGAASTPEATARLLRSKARGTVPLVLHRLLWKAQKKGTTVEASARKS